MSGLQQLVRDAARCAATFTTPWQLTVSDHAIAFVRERIRQAGREGDFPILWKMQGSSVVLCAALTQCLDGNTLESDEYGRWEVYPLLPAMAEAREALPLVGLAFPAGQRLSAGFRADTTLDDAQLLLSAIVIWGELGRESNGCLWIIA